jgi:hypothetical protein
MVGISEYFKIMSFEDQSTGSHMPPLLRMVSGGKLQVTETRREGQTISKLEGPRLEQPVTRFVDHKALELEDVF